jgi:hypothetical protein
MWVRRFVVVACATGLAGLAACTTAQEPSNTPSTVAAPTTAVSPSPSLASEAQLKAWVEAAQLTPTVVGAAEPARDQSGQINMVDTDVCGGDSASGDHLVYSHYSTWGGTNIDYVEHGVFAFNRPGSDMVAGFRGHMRSCQTYALGEAGSAAGSAQMTFNGDYDLPKPDGMDAAYAFCELSTTVAPESHKGEKAPICAAVLSRGQLATTVRVFGDSPTSFESAQSLLRQAVSIAAPALVSAVPIA